jgi:hypothetical protein
VVDEEAGDGADQDPDAAEGAAGAVDRLEVTWPAGQNKQTFRDIPAGQLVEITEGATSPRVIKRDPR